MELIESRQNVNFIELQNMHLIRLICTSRYKPEMREYAVDNDYIYMVI